MTMMPLKTLFRVAAVLGVGVGSAHAQMSLGLTAGVDRVENPLLEPVSPGSVTLFRVEPTYVYLAQGDRIRQRFSAAAVVERSSDTALLASRQYPSLGYMWTYSWPTSSLEFRTALTDTATRNTQFRELGRVTVDTKERQLDAGVRWDQELTPRTRMLVDMSTGRTRFDSDVFEDYREQRASTRFSWEASERMVYFFEPSYRKLMPTGTDPDTSQNRWLIGVRGDLTPEWSIAASAGHARARGFQASKGTVTQLQLNYTGSRFTSGLEWARDLDTGGTEAVYVSTQSIGLRFGYRVAEGTLVRLGYAHSRSDGPTGGRGSTVSLNLDHELSAQWTWTMGFEDRRSSGETRETGRGKAIRAGLTYAYPGR